ncbi:MAG: hypothetical protein DLM52_06385 [Chthoniobacterales bacterium]|nr:MAG: hypothetical protein DLM52_06385 [Chthoniobacterales bacterium]
MIVRSILRRWRNTGTKARYYGNERDRGQDPDREQRIGYRQEWEIVQQREVVPRSVFGFARVINAPSVPDLATGECERRGVRYPRRE